MNKREIARKLFAAKKYIEDHGWTHGRLERDDGSVCALGAIKKIEDIPLGRENDIVERSEAAQYLSNYIYDHSERFYDRWSHAAWQYNDATSREAVLEMFERAACQACKEADSEQA